MGINSPHPLLEETTVKVRAAEETALGGGGGGRRGEARGETTTVVETAEVGTAATPSVS